MISIICGLLLQKAESLSDNSHGHPRAGSSYISTHCFSYCLPFRDMPSAWHNRLAAAKH